MVKTRGTEILALTSILICYFLSSTNCVNITRDPRIVGGEDATEIRSYFGYQALLVRHSSHSEKPKYWPYYGGTIIDERHVLTCAHCVTEIPADSLEVIVGNNDANDRRFAKKAEKIQIHEQYDKETLHNDIALVKVKGRFTWNRFIRPIDLRYFEMEQFRANCKTTGYGKLRKNEAMSSKLLYVNVDIADRITCKAEVGVRDEEICASNTRSSACGGDAGAPLDCYGLLTGILSYSTNTCDPGYTAFVEVLKYLKWIKDHGGPSARVRTATRDTTSFASVTTRSSPVLSFILLLVIFFIGKIIRNC